MDTEKWTGRYRRKDEPLNAKCAFCKEPIWARMGVYTVYHGKANYANEPDTPPESYHFLLGNDIGVCCPACWKEIFAGKENPND